MLTFEPDASGTPAAPTGNPSGLLRRAHVRQIVTLLRSGPASRAELGARTGLSRTTVSGIVGRLLEAGVVAEHRPPRTRRTGSGRPTGLLALSERSVRSIGVSFNLASVAVAIADPLESITGIAEREHRRGLGWRDRGRLAVEAVRRLCAEHGIESLAPDGIGVGVVGTVAPGGPAGPWRPAVEELSRAYRTPVHVDNNQRLSALAEATWGAGSGRGSLLFFHLGEGIGSGIVLGGRLYRGGSGAAGEIGHVTAVRDGPECHCGKRGCLEQLVALPALLERAGIRGGGRPLRELAADPALRAELTTAAETCGQAVGAALTVLDVAHVVVGGLLAHAPGDVRRAFEREVRAAVLPAVRGSLAVTPMALPDTAGVMGGISLVHHSSPLLDGPDGLPVPAARTL